MKEQVSIALQFLSLPDVNSIILQVDTIQELWAAQKCVEEMIGRPYRKNFIKKQWVYKLDSVYKEIEFSVITEYSGIGISANRLFYVGRGRYE